MNLAFFCFYTLPLHHYKHNNSINMVSRLLSIITCLLVAISAQAGAPKYIFYFIGDGMGLAPVMVAEAYNRTVLGNDQHLTMLQFPVASMATSYSANRQITDSSAAGTALSTGYKTNNYMLGVTPDSVPVYSIAKSLKEAGYGVAIATTVTLNDATPAAFYGHAPSRKDYYDTGKGIIESNYDFFAGYNLISRNNNKGAETDLYDLIKKAGYKMVWGKDGYEKVKDHNKIVLLNKPNRSGHCGFTVDSLGDKHFDVPYLTRTCLNHLQKNSPDKFFMMIEGGNIDWIAHANDPGTVKSVLNFDQGIKIAYEFYLQHPDETLIVVTADHNTGGMTFGMRGNKRVTLKNLDYQKMSISTFQDICKDLQKREKAVEWDEMKALLSEKLGLYGAIEVEEKDDKAIQDAFNRTFKKNENEEVETLYLSYNKFVEIIFATFNRYTGIGWTTTGHTGDFTPVYAIGVGAEEFNGLNNNIDLPKKIAKIANVKF